MIARRHGGSTGDAFFARPAGGASRARARRAAAAIRLVWLLLNQRACETSIIPESGACVLVAALLPLSACATPPAYQPPQRTQAVRAVETPRRTDPPEPLSPAARELLKARMASHGRDMNDLVSAIMVLDYLRIEQRGDQIADDVTLARPVSHDATELNASLPEKFFVHQDNVKVEARALADAARAHDAYRVAEQYGRLSEGCVRCHADYRPRN